MRKKKLLATLCLVLFLMQIAMPAEAAVFSPDVRVLLSLGKQRSLSFTPVGKFTLKEDPSLVIGTEALTITAVGGRVSLEAGGKKVTAASLTLLSGDYGGRTDYIRIKNAEHGTCTYLGNMTFDVKDNAVRAINTLNVDQYLYGVVPHEMSNLFPIDALKAQAVCARGYAVSKCSKNAGNAYDLTDTSTDQVYRGYASKNTRAIAAVDETSGQVLTYEGDIIEAYYSASNGGQTERTGNVWENDLPYYTNADDPYDLLNASSIEEKSFIPEEFTAETIRLMDPFVLFALTRAANEAAGREVTPLKTISVTPMNPRYEEPSRVYEDVEIVMQVGYEALNETLEGQVTIVLKLDELQFGSYENTLGRIGAKKTRLRMRGAERGTKKTDAKQYAGWYITERRYGHGVGLSQRSAQERARHGESYTDILSFYYVNTALHTVGTYETAPKITSESLRVQKAGISGISPGTTAEDVLKKLSSQGELSAVTAKGVPLSGAVTTGSHVRITYHDGASFFDLPIILYGDLDGDGVIAQKDVEALQNHLLHSKLLTGARLNAADVNHDGKIDSTDLITLIRYVNGDAKISQEGN
ncbi:SpoIID/LytB domain-containing protein [Christensenellaceae bacterium OttesenSCG-928-M15]|nr:SpoIID/LytB domain-containing protein [Christensenellaceae bacterium OttesenSCG-928-M15]